MAENKWVGNIETAKRYERKAHNMAVKYSEIYTADQVAMIIWNKYGFLSMVKNNIVTFKTQLGILSIYNCKE